MFEIGNTLREARLRAGLDLQECAERTKIRGKYLRALESEEFDVLPSPTYVRGFLRNYAEFLGLDWQLVLDEHESRFGRIDPLTGEMAGPARRPRPNQRRGSRGPKNRPRGRRTEAQMLWFAVGGVLGVALIVWLGVGDPNESQVRIPDQRGAETAAPAAAASGAARAATAVAPVRPARAAATDTTEAPQRLKIRLSGVGERGSWVEVRARGPRGRAVFTGVLGDGESRAFTVSRSLWVRAGYAEGLAVTVNGAAQEISGGVADFLISGRGAERL